MARLINNTERVLQRLVYEGALLHNRFTGKRFRITLPNILAAGKVEPRVLEVLPAILRLKPKIVTQIKDLKHFPQLKKLIDDFDFKKAPSHWEGIPIEELRRQEKRLAQLWNHQFQQTKWRNINIRVSDEDIQKLNQLALKQGHGNKSEVIRRWITAAG